MKTTASKIENAMKAAQEKVYFWAAEQTKRHHRKNELRAAGETAKADWQLRLEMRAGARRYRAEGALEKLMKMQREG